MGWCSGEELAERVWCRLKPLLKPGTEKLAAQALVEEFEAFDCDTVQECDFWQEYGEETT
jgi:hypothetical protein